MNTPTSPPTRPHIDADGRFQSDKYPTCPAGKVPLSVKDKSAQDLLWEYAQRRRGVDAEFADDLEFALTSAGYKADPAPGPLSEDEKLAGEVMADLSKRARYPDYESTQDDDWLDDLAQAVLRLSRELREAHAVDPRGDLLAAEVNAMPKRVRSYIHDLASRADPAGDCRDRVLLKDQNAELQAALTTERTSRIAAEAARDKAVAERDGEREARDKLDKALRAKDAEMGVLFQRLDAAGVDCSDLIS